MDARRRALVFLLLLLWGAVSAMADQGADFGDLSRQPGEDGAGQSAAAPNGGAGGRGQALVIRAGELAIPPSIQRIVRRAQASLRDVDSTRKTLENFSKDYLVDCEATVRFLEGMGYRVVTVYSSDHRNAESFRAAVRKAIEDPATGVVVFFGHGNDKASVALYGPESGFLDVDAPLRGTIEEEDTDFLYARELQTWLGGRKLDALILHGCHGAYQTYLTRRQVPGRQPGLWKPRWDELVSDTGFFAGWLSYAIYFNPNTTKILEAFRKHAASKPAKQELYFIRIGPFLRDLGVVLSHADDDDYWQFLCRDKTIHVHDEVPDDVARLFMPFVFGLVHPERTLVETVRRLAVDFQAMRDRLGVGRAGDAGGRIGPDAKAQEVARFVNAHAQDLLHQILQIALPGSAFADRAEVRLTEGKPNDLEFCTRFRIVRGQEIDRLFACLGERLDKEGAGLGDGIDREKLAKALESFRKRFPSFDVQLDGCLTKVVGGDGVSFVPRLRGYRMLVGGVDEKTVPRRSPYEIHLAVAALNDLLRPIVEGFCDGAAPLGPRATVSLHRFEGVNVHWRDQFTVVVSARWSLCVDWPLGGKGYAYATTKFLFKRRMMSTPNRILVYPAIELTLEEGWGPSALKIDALFKWILTHLVDTAFAFFAGKINGLVKEALGEMLPPVDGRPQTISVRRVDRAKDTVTATLSSFEVDLQSFVPPASEGGKTIFERVRVVDVESWRERVSIYLAP